MDQLIKNVSACDRAQALIPLALEGTEAGKVKASHALAKIAAISNPEIAFPGERVSQLFFCFARKTTWLPGEELSESDLLLADVTFF